MQESAATIIFLPNASKKGDMYLLQIDFILVYEYQGFILVFPLTPHGSAYSLGLLFQPDKQVFFLFMAIIA